MGRWVRRILVGVSFVLMLACAGMWVRSQFAIDAVGYRHHQSGADKVHTRSRAFACYRNSLKYEFIWFELHTDSRFASTDSWEDRYPHGLQAAADDPATLKYATTGLFNQQRGGTWMGFHVEHRSKPAALLGLSVSYQSRAYVLNDFGVWAIGLPWWFLILLFSLAPTISFLRWRRRRRVPAGCCIGCGYDLRATPDGGGAMLAVCPECGRNSASD